MSHTARWTRPLRSVVCDRALCPAPAQRRLDVAGQDFYFCDHHAVEIDLPLADADRTVSDEHQDGNAEVLVGG